MKSYNPQGVVDAEKIGYSHAVETDGQLYISGQVGWNDQFETPGSFDAQVRLAFENLGVILDDAGRTRGDIAKVTAYLLSPEEHTDEFLDQWRTWAPEDPHPCLTILGVGSLAREEFLVELEADVVPANQSEP
jgi:enamine deaminase RidA (YjgF/YER057c/UK114 family)